MKVFRIHILALTLLVLLASQSVFALHKNKGHNQQQSHHKSSKLKLQHKNTHGNNNKHHISSQHNKSPSLIQTHEKATPVTGGDVKAPVSSTTTKPVAATVASGSVASKPTASVASSAATASGVPSVASSVSTSASTEQSPTTPVVPSGEAVNCPQPPIDCAVHPRCCTPATNTNGCPAEPDCAIHPRCCPPQPPVVVEKQPPTLKPAALPIHEKPVIDEKLMAAASAVCQPDQSDCAPPFKILAPTCDPLTDPNCGVSDDPDLDAKQRLLQILNVIEAEEASAQGKMKEENVWADNVDTFVNDLSYKSKLVRKHLKVLAKRLLDLERKRRQTKNVLLQLRLQGRMKKAARDHKEIAELLPKVKQRFDLLAKSREHVQESIASIRKHLAILRGEKLPSGEGSNEQQEGEEYGGGEVAESTSSSSNAAEEDAMFAELQARTKNAQLLSTLNSISNLVKREANMYGSTLNDIDDIHDKMHPNNEEFNVAD